MDEIKAELSEAEREALKALWDTGPATVRRVLEELEQRGRTWAYSTVATLLRRLEAKGYALADGSGGPLVYESAVTREELIERRLNDAADELCDGKAAPLVLALVQGHRFTAEELDRLGRMIDEARRNRQANKGG